MSVYPWNRSAWEYLTASRARSTHAWLFAGPAGLGKSQCAMAFARRLVGADDDQRAAELFDAGTHPDVHVIARDIDAEDSDALEHRYARRHLDERAKGSKPRSVITIGQIRRLVEVLATRAHSGRHKVALLLDAHLMNINAANALLKVLEEPPEDTVLVCVSDQLHRLPATVRSRCSILTFAPPPRDEARGWLAEQLDSEAIEVALDLAGGAPLAARTLIEEDRIEARRQWLAGLEALFSTKAEIGAVADLGKQTGLHDTLALSQKVLIDLVRCRLGAPVDRLFNSDKSQWLQKRSERLQLESTFDLIDAIGRMRQDVDGPLDTQLVIEDMLIRMRQAVDRSP